MIVNNWKNIEILWISEERCWPWTVNNIINNNFSRNRNVDQYFKPSLRRIDGNYQRILDIHVSEINKNLMSLHLPFIMFIVEFLLGKCHENSCIFSLFPRKIKYTIHSLQYYTCTKYDSDIYNRWTVWL